LLWISLAATLVGLVMFLYLVSVHAVAADSDSASVLLVGQSIGKGNVLLHSWGLSLDSFWTIDAPFYAVAYLFDGLRPSLLYVVPAFIAAIVVVVGVLMTREDTKGSAAAAGSLAVVALLALPTHALATFFLQGPLHIATALLALIAFWASSRDRFGWSFVIAVAALAAGILGDLQAVTYGIVPVLLGGISAMARRRTWRAGIVPVTAAGGAVAVALAVRRLAETFGTFSVGAANPMASIHQMVANVGLIVSYGGELLGVKSTLFGTDGVPDWLQAVHVVGAAVIVLSFVAAFALLAEGVVLGRQRHRTSVGRSVGDDVASPQGTPWRLDDMLVIACVTSATTFVVLTTATNQAFARYLTAWVIFGVILAGRMVARWWSHPTAARFRHAGTVVGLTAALAFAAGDACMVSAPEPTQPVANLATWLVAHQLTNGVGDYWSASITTVESRGLVIVRPVLATSDNLIARYPRESQASWYGDTPFQFLVFNTSNIWISVDSYSATETWGTPAHTYAVGTYRVLIWSHPISVAQNTNAI
jgi:hypothetical protein